MKKILALIFVSLMSIALYFSPLKIVILNWMYPSYIELIEKGYVYDEIKDFHATLSEDEYTMILSLDYAYDIKKQVTNLDYKSLRDKNYSEEEADEILGLDSELISFYLNHENLSEYYDLIHHDYFILDRFDRYISYMTKFEELDITTITRMVNANRDYELYTHIQAANTSNPVEILVNKYYQLEANYVPDLEETYLGFMMQEDAAHSLDSMIEAMLALGLDISISNSYRPYVMQERIYNRYLETQSQAIVDTYSARPGHSEHQAGLAVDFKTQATGITDFGGSEAYQWLKENAHIYGFIQRYTEENSIYTGYQAEEWHFRYVGSDLAKIVYETGLTLDEVLVLYR